MTAANADRDGGRQSLVLVPGLSGRASEDFPFLLPMLQRVCDVHPVDFTGIGASDDVGFLIERIDAAVRNCSTKSALAGYSIGAVAGAAYAATHPFALTDLVLVAGWLAPAPKLVAFADVWRRLSEAGPDTSPLVAQAQLYSAEGWTAARPPLVDPVSSRLVELAATADVTDLAASIGVPTLVVGCSHDEVATTSQSRLLFGAIPDARYCELDSGHAVVHERPAELLHQLVSFLTDPTRHPAGAMLPESRP